MNRFAKPFALVAAAALSVPVLALAAPAAHADGQEREREFGCRGADVDFSVEKDDGRFEIDVDVDDARQRSAWRVKLTHDGKVVHNRVHRADSDGDFDVDKVRRNTAGKDTFKLTIRPVGKKACTARIVMR